jgi:hypothetical protein
MKAALPFLMLAVLFIGGSCDNEVKQSGEHGLLALGVPIYSGGTDVSEFMWEGTNISGLSYRVSLPFPSRNVLEYYDSEFGMRGFVVQKQTSVYENREWYISYSDKYAEVRASAYLRSYWIDPKARRVIRLNLFYDYRQDPSGEIQNVVIDAFEVEPGKAINSIDAYEEFAARLKTK